MTEQKRTLSTEDIRVMSLKEFMAHRHDKSRVFACRDLQQANSTQLLVSDLEAVDSLKKLKKLTEQLKEDLWWDIHNGGNGHDK